MGELSIKKHIWEFLSAVLFFLSMQPGFMWSANPTFIRVVLIFILLYKLKLKERGNILLLILFFLVLSIYPITHNNSLFGFIYFTTLALIPFSDSRFLLDSFSFFRKILAVLTVVSLVLWILVTILDVDLPYEVLEPLNDLKNYVYHSYFFLVVPDKILDAEFIKFCCMFDEPGVVGTYSLLLLFADNFNFKNRENIVFLISGIVSFSFFFYLGLIMFLIANTMLGQVKIKYKVLTVIIAVGFLIAIQSIPILNDMVGYRLEYDSTTGKLVGDNRSSDDLDSYIASIRGTSAYYWGDRDDIVNYYLLHAGLNTAILRYGIVFIFLYIMFFVLFSYRMYHRNYKEIFLFAVAILATLYQRPGFVNPPFILMFAGIVITRANNLITYK